MKNIFCQDINMQKMTGFLDEKYTLYIWKTCTLEGPIFWWNMLAKKHLCLQMACSSLTQRPSFATVE
jgi:hypothetical protein